MPAGPAPVEKVLRYKPEESMGVWEYGSLGVYTFKFNLSLQEVLTSKIHLLTKKTNN
jgi:hypothetical protein